jgi:ArsR family transcriptional regulator
MRRMADTTALINTLKLLSDQTRLRILSVLDGNELTVKELTEILSIGQSTLSTQLGQMKDGLLLTARKEGQFVYYRMARTSDEGFQSEMIKQLLGEISASDWYQRDRRKLQEVLFRRREASLSFFNSQLAQNQVSPGQTWESLSLGLASLIHNQDIIDLGCGSGRLAATLAESGNRVTGMDNSQEQINIAHNLYRNQASVGDRLRFMCAPMEDSGLPAASFDIAIISQSLHHAAQPAQALREASRILRSNGQILILDLVSHSQDWVHDKFADFWLGFQPEDLAQWLQDAGFSQIRQRICGPDPVYPAIETLIVSGRK